MNCQSRTSRLSLKRKLSWLPGMALGGLLFIAVTSAGADPITGINVNITGSANEIIATGNDRAKEFRSANISTSPVTVSGNIASFTNHFGWMMADVVESGGPNFALIYLRRVGYTLEFTVEDPTNVGYSLSVDTALRGYKTARLDSGPSDAFVAASGTTLYGRIDTGSGFSGLLGGLTATATPGILTVDAATPFGNVLTTGASSYNAGAFTGTRTFRLEFGPGPSPNTITLIQNFTRGEAALRFGLNPTHVGGASGVHSWSRR